MPTVKVDAQISPDELLQALQQLDRAELERFLSKAVAMRAENRVPSLPKDEAELLRKINQGLPPDVRKRYSELIAKRQSEELTSQEHKELISLTDRVEKLEAERVEYLAELARLRNKSITEVMEELEIPPRDYA